MEDGTPEAVDGPPLPETAEQVCQSMVPLYKSTGFDPPWIGYLALKDGEWVGTCAFKTPPVDNRVEIAYFTFPDFEGQGFATQMAVTLLTIAHTMDPKVEVTAHTMPVENASNSILKKLGFQKSGAVHDPEAGPVWEWTYGSNR